jgi:hypothetical protein
MSDDLDLDLDFFMDSASEASGEGAEEILEDVGEVVPIRASGTRARRWLFVINNYPEDAVEYLSGICEDQPDIRYLVFQCEEGENGTPHIQGYVEFKAVWRFSRVKRLVSPVVGAHIEMARGSGAQNRAYCTKEESRVSGPYEFGVMAAQGRHDLTKLKTLIDEGASEKCLWETSFGSMVRYYRGILQYRMVVAPQRNFVTELIFCFGVPGTGKSRWAYENHPGAYWKQPSHWWDSYNGEETVVLDDFYGWLPYHDVLRLADRYPLLVETKGGQVNFCAKRIIMTSNARPLELWSKIEDKAAFIRRISLYKFFSDQVIDTVDHDEFLRLTQG